MNMIKTSRFFFLLLCLGFSSFSHAYTFEFNRAELQQYVVDYFPLRQQTPFSQVTYSNPSVVLNEADDRIGLEVTVRAQMQGMMAISGRGRIDGNLEYRHDTHQFYLHDPKISNIRFANADHQLTDTVQQMVNSISNQALPMIFVYELKDSDLREKMTKSVLKEVSVRQGKLYLDVDLAF